MGKTDRVCGSWISVGRHREGSCLADLFTNVFVHTRIIAPRLLGYDPHEDYIDTSFQPLIDYIDQWLRQVDTRTAHVIGHGTFGRYCSHFRGITAIDWGSAAAYAFCRRQLKRCKSLTLVAVPPLANRELAFA